MTTTTIDDTGKTATVVVLDTEERVAVTVETHTAVVLPEADTEVVTEYAEGVAVVSEIDERVAVTIETQTVVEQEEYTVVISEGVAGPPGPPGPPGSGGSSSGAIRVDFTDPEALYRGVAPVGSAAEDPVWTISKVTTVGSSIDSKTAAGLYSWPERAALTYV